MTHGFHAAAEGPFPGPGAYSLRSPDGALGETRSLARDETAEDDGKGRIFLCYACGNFITTAGDRIAVGGAHRHVFTNPSGIVFDVALFAGAEGCVQAGLPTREFSWFAGYAWNFALCAACGAHLGWRYSSGNDFFFGLIADHLVEKTIDS